MVKLTTLTNLILTGCHRQGKKKGAQTAKRENCLSTTKVNVKILLESKTNASDLQGGLNY